MVPILIGCGEVEALKNIENPPKIAYRLISGSVHIREKT